MKLVLSPSKTLDFESANTIKKSTTAQFLAESKTLAAETKKLSEKQIAKLMDISPKLAELNYGRYQNFTKQPERQAIQAFKGDVYEGLAAEDFSAGDITFAQKHLLILSGLYGLLRPLDLIRPYRLEMGLAFKNGKNKNLYEFWGDKLTKEIGDELIINLASVEYFSAIKPKNYINVVFKESKNGKLSIVALFAKKARGMMARYAIKNKITAPEDLKKFTDGGYKFKKELSNAKSFVFVR